MEFAMNLEWSVIISTGAVIFSAGSAWGIVRNSLKIYTKEIEEIKKKLAALENCDDVVRKYLFANDGMTVYVPAAFCGKQHERQDELFSKLTEKMDKVIEILMEKHNK